MAITGYLRGEDNPDEVYFQVPSEYPKQAKRVRLLLLIALVTSVWTAIVNAGLAMDAFDLSTKLQDDVIRLVEDEQGPVRRALEDPQLARSLLEAGGIEVPPGEVTPEQLADGIQKTRDLSSILRNTCGDLMLLFMALTIYFPFKYFFLLRGVKKGHPETYRKIHATALSQVLLEAARMALIWDVTQHSYALEVPNPISASLVLGLIMLFYLRNRTLRAYFSHFVVKPAPPAAGAPEPATAPAGGDSTPTPISAPQIQ